MKLRFTISILVSTLLLCGNAFSKPDHEAPPDVDVNVINTPDVNVVSMPDVNVVSMPDVNVVSMPDVNVANTPDVNVINTPSVSIVEDRITIWGQSSKECGESGCSFVSASTDSEDVPEGKMVLVDTVNVTYGQNFNTYEATAAIQLNSPSFQRFLVGEVIPTPGFTGADGMATASLNFVLTHSLTAVVGFPGVRPPEGEIVAVDVFVSGRLVDAPVE